MFDELHDPHPPAITGRHLAEVAERAAGIRRRRTAVTGAVAVVALAAAGTIGVAATNRTSSDRVDVADAPLPTVAAAPDGETAPTTTALDPESLPPATPVNPDPEDLPPAVPVNPDPDDADAGNAIGDDAPTDSSGDSDAPGADSGEADGDGAGDDASPVLDVATAAAMRADDPILAITTTGDAVWFPLVGDESEPVVIASDADRLDFLADGTAVVGSGSSLELIGADGDSVDQFIVGTSATIDPSGTVAAALDGDTLVVFDPLDPDESTVVTQLPASAVDLWWFDDRSVIALGSSGSMLMVVDTAALASETSEASADQAAVVRTIEVPDVSGDTLRFAGADVTGSIVLHDAGTAAVFTVSLDGTATESELDAPARSVWFDGSEVITVSPDGTLTDTVGPGAGTALAGTYLTARR